MFRPKKTVEMLSNKAMEEMREMEIICNLRVLIQFSVYESDQENRT